MTARWALFAGLLAAHGLAFMAMRRLPWPAASERRAGGLRADGTAAVMVVVGVTVLGAMLRLNALDAGLWYDEIQTLIDYARLPFARIITTYDSTNQHLLYSIAAHASMNVFGESAWALRLPAVVFGVASLPAAYAFSRRLAPPVEAALVTALLAVSYHHVWFSQNARGYTGLLLFTLLGTGWFLDLLRGEGRPRRTVLAYAAAMALATFTHVTAALIVLAHALVWVAGTVVPRKDGRSRASWWPPLLALVLAGTLSLLLYAPVLAQVVHTVLHPRAAGAPTAIEAQWKHPAWFVAETVRGLALGLPGGWVTLVIGAVLIVAGVARIWRTSPAAVGLMLLPCLLTGGVLLAMHHNLWPRFFFFASGFLVLIAVRGGFALAQRLWPARGAALATAGGTLGALLSAATVPRAWGPKQDFAAAERFVASARAARDAVVTVDLTTLPYLRYRGQPWDTVATASDLEAIERDHARTFVLYTFPIHLQSQHPDVWRRLHTSYDTAAVFPGTVGGGAVVVMVSKSPPSPW